MKYLWQNFLNIEDEKKFSEWKLKMIKKQAFFISMIFFVDAESKERMTEIWKMFSCNFLKSIENPRNTISEIALKALIFRPKKSRKFWNTLYIIAKTKIFS